MSRFVADERLLSRLLRRKEVLPYRPPSLPIRLKEFPLHVEPADWRTGFVRIEPTLISEQVAADLQQVTPQALLRDLHGPVFDNWHVDWQANERPNQRPAAALREIREAQRRSPAPRWARAGTEMRAARRAWLRFMRDPWQPHLADDAPRNLWTTLVSDTD